MKLFGSLLIGCAGFWWWSVCLRERKKRLQTVEELLGAVYQLREGIRTERLPIPQLLARLGDQMCFFEKVSTDLRGRETLSETWEEAMEELPLSPEIRSVWLWLGNRFSGDERGVLRALDYTERELEAARQKMFREEWETARMTAVGCFSAAAFLVILLL